MLYVERSIIHTQLYDSSCYLNDMDCHINYYQHLGLFHLQTQTTYTQFSMNKAVERTIMVHVYINDSTSYIRSWIS